MELEVLRHTGIPETGIISIRAGGTRRQAQISSLDRPLKFPCGPEEAQTFKVDVLDLLGSGRVAYNPEEDQYVMGLESATDSSIQTGMEVAFSIKRAGAGGATGNSTLPRPVEADQGAPSEDEKDAKKEVSARDYLEKHGLTNFMQFLMQSLMKDKPADPYSFLQKQVTKRMVSEVSRSIIGEKVDLLPDGQVESLLAKFSEGQGPHDVTQDQLKKLEQDAASAGEQLREDNAKLRQTAEELKTKYGKLVEETSQISQAQKVVATSPYGGQALSPMPAYNPNETTAVAAYREIAIMQDEVISLAKENSLLVAQLSSMRCSIDAVRGEIEEMSQNT